MTVEQGYHAARLVGLSILGSLQRELGTLDVITSIPVEIEAEVLISG